MLILEQMCKHFVGTNKTVSYTCMQVSVVSAECKVGLHCIRVTGKNNGFPFLDILGYLKNTHKNPKFRRVRQVPIWELSWEFPGWDLSHFAKCGIFMGIL